MNTFKKAIFNLIIMSQKVLFKSTFKYYLSLLIQMNRDSCSPKISREFAARFVLKVDKKVN